jgi:hypothetical protein
MVGDVNPSSGHYPMLYHILNCRVNHGPHLRDRQAKFVIVRLVFGQDKDDIEGKAMMLWIYGIHLGMMRILLLWMSVLLLKEPFQGAGRGVGSGIPLPTQRWCQQKKHGK